MSKESLATDRRNAPRQSVVYRLDVLSEDGEVGCLLDISLTGMRVRFKSEVDIGHASVLTLEFPRWLELGEGLTLTGRFAWIKPRGEDVRDLGFAFDGLGRKEAGVLAVLIQRLSEAKDEDQL